MVESKHSRLEVNKYAVRSLAGQMVYARCKMTSLKTQGRANTLVLVTQTLATHVQTEQVRELLDRQTADLLALALAEGAVREQSLALLQSENAVLDGVVDDKTLDAHLARLPEPMHAIESLRLHRLRPPEVEGNDVVRASEIEPDTYAMDEYATRAEKAGYLPPHLRDMSMTLALSLAMKARTAASRALRLISP